VRHLANCYIPVTFYLFLPALVSKLNVDPELSMGPFCVTQPNPLQVEKFGPNPTQPNTTNNRAYSLVVTYFYTKNLSCIFLSNKHVLYCHYTYEKQCHYFIQKQEMFNSTGTYGRRCLAPLSQHHWLTLSLYYFLLLLLICTCQIGCKCTH